MRLSGDRCPDKASLTQTISDEEHRDKRRKVVSGALTSSLIAPYESIITRAIVVLLD